MNTRRVILFLRLAVFGVVFFMGCRVGMQPLVILAILLTLFIPPLAMHILACQKVIRRTKAQHPEFWAKISSGMGMDVRCYLFDDQSFGDKELLEAKANLKWWHRAALIGIALFIPTLFVINMVSK